MRYGFVFPNGSAREQLELAEVAEASGWDGVFVWEGPYGVDAWGLLAAMAVRTERIRLGTMLTPVPWRRPWKLASQVATVDELSGGRVILAVGLGAPDVIPRGEVTDKRERAQLLDEGLEIVRGLWRGERRFRTAHHDLELPAPGGAGAPVAYRPVQDLPPIWVVGAWPERPKSMSRIQRAADGLLPNVFDDEGAHRPATPGDFAAMRGWLDANGGVADGFDMVMEGETPGDDADTARATVRPFADAGCTWWLEARWSAEGSPADVLRVVRERLEAGPPRV